MRIRRLVAACAAAPLVLLAAAPGALADNIYNNLDTGIDAVAEVMPLNVGGPARATTLAVEPTGGDGKAGCNLTKQTTLTLAISSSNTSVATVSPGAVTFISCGDTPTLTVTPVGVGSATISATEIGNATGATFNLAPATFTVNVTAPPPANTAPQLIITGVEQGASYPITDMPAAVCSVTDAEDGSSTFPATLSDITGDPADGIGTRTASCSYTDHNAGGGLTASSSVTYSIVDPSAPVVGYSLDPAQPGGQNGWYRGDVTLTWHVTEPESPNSLVLVGCQDQTITADQGATDYTCQATSAGGASQPVTATVARDGTAPNAPTATVNPAANDAGWNNTDVTVTFSDAGDTGFSGIDHCTAPQKITTEGANQTVTGDCVDVAGNTGPDTKVTVNVDKTAPAVSPDVAVAGQRGLNDWFTSDVDVTFSATDALSGPASQTETVTSAGEGDDVVVASPVFTDAAGNNTDAGAVTTAVKVDKTPPSRPEFTGMTDGASYDFGAVAPPPKCAATDTVSGFDRCDVSGYSTAVGTHTLTATAYDNAGNRSENTLTYTVNPYRWSGFYAPVDMGATLNTVKAGSTVPLKFEAFTSTGELTSTAVVDTFSVTRVSCSDLATSQSDAVEFTTTGGTTLRYDATAGQFIQSWKTPSTPATCYAVSVTTNDGRLHGPALFKLK